MSTTRIVNGVEYVIPPGTEHVWTPPEQVKVTPPETNIPIPTLIDNLRVHKLVRQNNPEKVEALIVELDTIWQKFNNKTINSGQLSNELGKFRTETLSSMDGYDDITVQIFEDVLVRMMAVSSTV
jgi:hypothetical protein